LEQLQNSVIENVKKPISFHTNVSTVIRGGSITVVGKMFNNLIRLALAIILARVLGTVQLGYYTLALSTLNIAMGVALFGLDAAVIRFIAVMQSRDDTQKTWESIQIGTGVSLIFSTFIGIFLYVFSYYLAVNVFNDLALVPYLQLISIFLPMLVLNDQLSNVLKGFKKFDLSVFSQYIFQPISRLVITGIILVIGLNAKTAILAYCLATVSSTAILIYFLNRDFSFKGKIKVSGSLLRETLSFSVPVWLSSLLSKFKNNIQTLFIGSWDTIAGVGIFAVASQITFVSSEISSSINVTSKPIIAELVDQGDISQMERIYQLSNKWIVITQIPIFLAMVLFPKTLLQIFGKEFADGSLTLIILAFGSLLKVGTGMGGIIIDMAGYTKMKLVNSILQVITFIILNIILIPRWGLVGAAVAAVVGEGFINIIRLLEVFFIYKIIPFNRSFYKPLLATIGAVGAFFLVLQVYNHGENFLLAGLNMSIMVLAYVGIIYLLGFSKDETEFYGSFITSLKRKVKKIGVK
jgi:O-antigen/teichoic acid export membrane protein